MPRVIIRGIGSCLPRHSVTNVQLLKQVKGFDHEAVRVSFMKRAPEGEEDSYHKLTRAELFDLWVRRVCGVEKRPFAEPGEFPDQLVCEAMAEQAALQALAAARMPKEDIKHVIFSTYSSNRLMPSPAATLVSRLGLKQGVDGVSAITLNGACSGFLDGLIDGMLKIQAGFATHVLIVAAENMSDKMDYADPTSCIIFSDGAGACILSASADDHNTETHHRGEILSVASAIDYSEQINMQRTGPIYFNKGPYVQRNAVQAMYSIGHKALKKSGLSMDRMQYVIPHQANARITAALRKKVEGEGCQHTLDTIAFTGNLSSATIPVALDFLIKGKLKAVPYKEDSYALLASVGGGYTYSAAVVML